MPNFLTGGPSSRYPARDRSGARFWCCAECRAALGGAGFERDEEGLACAAKPCLGRHAIEENLARGSVECLSVLEGEIEVDVGGSVERVRAGETLRYRCDRPHRIRNLADKPAHATMVNILKAAMID